MLGAYMVHICWVTAIFSAVWFRTALIKPGFISLLNKKGKIIWVAICAAITAFLFFMSIVAVVLLIEHYRFV